MISRTKLGAVVLGVFLAFFILVTAQRGWIMLRDPDPVATLIGVAFLILPLIGAWALVVEFRFGSRIEKLGRILEAEGRLPDDDLPRTPSGRVVRDAADGVFEKYRRETEEAPEDWRSWFRLACIYDAARDRRRAREAMRRAIALHKQHEGRLL
ncbi:hypothetical protein GCM10027079_01130 [Sediminivirga luteola]|uniref:Tetratricopeptide repeat protein n=1 Tax=Sediminivirga luteola TaxID=1774748 RepID=A0A8J2TXC4_9MICO|nr:hypothetical protein [Sediminivirga luteola]GGA11879.1 hypothetical protein GCM10011333_13510 [Sediminivirga luteola]